MNLLAKHFFDYQSFVNLPHKAIQLHKTPPSQAGVDPSASWAPKSMHVAGKNQSAPAARANRHHVEPRMGGHRHGRPNKLEFRHWGERHGELHAEKIVPHKDEWMRDLKGDFRHFYEYDEGFGSDGVESAIKHFPTFSQRCVEVGDLEVLAILTLNSKKDMVMVTIKAIRGFSHFKNCPTVKLQLFDGGHLIEERRSRLRFGTSLENISSADKVFGHQMLFGGNHQMHASAPLLTKAADYAVNTTQLSPSLPRLSAKTIAAANCRRVSRGIGRIAEAQIPRPIQQFRPNYYLQNPASANQRASRHSISHFRRFRSQTEDLYRIVPPLDEKNKNCCSHANKPIPVLLNHNGGPAVPNIPHGDMTASFNRVFPAQQIPIQKSVTYMSRCLLLEDNNHPRRSFSPHANDYYHTTTRTNSITTIPETNHYRTHHNHQLDNDDNEELITNVSESFMLRVPSSRLVHCHFLVQIFARARSPTPPPPPSSMNILEHTKNARIHRASTEYLDDEEDIDDENLGSFNPLTMRVCLNPDDNLGEKLSLNSANNFTNNYANNHCDTNSYTDTLSAIADQMALQCLECANQELFNKIQMSASPIINDEISKMIDQCDDNEESDSVEDYASASSHAINEKVQNDKALMNCNASELDTVKDITETYNIFHQYGAVNKNETNEHIRVEELISETPLEFSSKDSKESTDSLLEELVNDGGASAILYSSECGCSCEDELSSSEAGSNVNCGARNARHNSSVTSSSGTSGTSNSGGRPTKSRDLLVGGFVIGQLGSSRGRWQWRQVVQQKGHPVCMWHRLIRPSPTTMEGVGLDSSTIASIESIDKLQTSRTHAKGPNIPTIRRCRTLDSPQNVQRDGHISSGPSFMAST